MKWNQRFIGRTLQGCIACVLAGHAAAMDVPAKSASSVATPTAAASVSATAPAPATTAASVQAPQPATLAGLLAQLPDADYDGKQDLIQKIIALRHANTRVVLSALLEGRLYQRGADHKIFIAEETDSGFRLTDPETLQSAGTATADAVDKVGTNNSLRKLLRGAIAEFALADPDRRVRLSAVNEMMRSLDETEVNALRARLPVENDAGVRKAITAALALVDLSSDDANTRLRAVQALHGSLNGDVFNRLQALVAGPDGKRAEPDDRVYKASLLVIDSIKRWRSVYGAVETLFFGLSLGSVLVLAAIGLAITFGVMGVINMAHGELMMLGAYTTYCVQLLMPHQLGLSIALSIPAAFIVAGLFGVAIERGIVRFLYGRPLETLLATFGVSLVLQQLVRSIFSPLNRSVATPPFMSGTLQINDALTLTYNRLYIVVFSLLVFAILQLVLKRTPLGLRVRAVSQNRSMARAMGIRTDWVDAATFGLGSGIAGVAGVALSQLTNVGPNLGQAYIIDSFMVVVFGGVGNLWGTLIGGMGLGVGNKLLEPLVGAVMAKILILVFIILFIQRRKQGLFPQKGRAAEGL